MGEIVGAGLLAHVPTIVLPEEERLKLNEGKEITLVTGLRQLRRDVFERDDYDTVVVLDSHWATTVEAPGWGGPNMWFVRVPEPKTAKNRMHFDLRAEGSVAAEVARLVDLGATIVNAGEDLTVMRDPDGTEFCVE